MMRVRATAATAALLLAALTACGGGDDGGKTDSASKPKAAASKTADDFDCMAENGSQDDWMKHCSDEGAGTGGDGGAGEAGKTLQLGQSTETTGDGGTGVLQITPDTVVFTKQASGETAKNGIFAVVTTKDKAMTAVAADEPAPISGGGWSWIAADGEAIGSGGGNSFNIVIDKYNNADPVQPGTFQWRLTAFDLTEAQAKGGTLMYTDGLGTTFRWKMPEKDAGPSAAEVKQELES